MNNQAPLTAQALIEVKDLSFKRGERVIYDQVNLKIRQWSNYGHYGTIGYR
jgi:phospholipid/cholesterol/gamma-HCH transport system ATP-binding protein